MKVPETHSEEEEINDYNKTVRILQEYLQVRGMFETRKRDSYGVHGSHNEDLVSWLDFPLNKALNLNEMGYL